MPSPDGKEGPLKKLYRVSGMPSKWLIDKNGNVISHQFRSRELNKLVRDLISTKGAYDETTDKKSKMVHINFRDVCINIGFRNECNGLCGHYTCEGPHTRSARCYRKGGTEHQRCRQCNRSTPCSHHQSQFTECWHYSTENRRFLRYDRTDNAQPV